MMSKKITSTFYVISALISGSMGFTMGYYSEFLRAAGLNEFWVNMVNLSFFITITVFEIPTGLFADIFGRKGSLVISLILSSISLAIYGLSHCFIGFVVSEIIIGMGHTFMSGAFDAWLTDSLNTESKKYNLVKIYKNNSWFCLASAILMGMIGGVASKHGLNMPFFCGSILFVIAAVVTCVIMKETRQNIKVLSFRHYIVKSREIWVNSVLFARTDKNFLFVLISSGVMAFAVMTTNMQWPKICKAIGYDASDNGIVGGVILFMVALGSALSKYLRYGIKNQKIEILLGQIIVGVGIASALLFASKYSIIFFFLLHEMGRGAVGTLRKAFTQECIASDDERATLGSFVSMVEHCGGAVGLIVSGIVAECSGFMPAWVLSGTLLIIFSVILLLRYKKKLI